MDEAAQTAEAGAVGPRTLVLRDRAFHWGRRTYLAGIINVTPDSFSGDGLARDVPAAVQLAARFEAEGADLIDLGGESTRPGAAPVDEVVERERVLPALHAILRACSLPVSVDTRKAGVAAAAIAEGVSIVNDVSGMTFDPEMPALVAETGVAVVLMAHHRHTGDVVAGVASELDELVGRALAAGIEGQRIIVDPGFGFGKDWRANLELLSHLEELQRLGYPVLAGLSRKSTIDRVLGPGSAGAPAANAALTALAVACGADILRVHDVAAARVAARLADAVVRRPLHHEDYSRE